MQPPKNIGRGEMEILQYVQDHGMVTVRQAAAHFAETKGHVRTTVLNVMERLRKKGYLTRKKRDGVFHYRPSHPKSEFLRTLVRDFVQRTLGGSVSPLTAYLLTEAEVTEEELKELKNLVRELDRKDEPGGTG